MSNLSIEQRANLVRSVGEEIVGNDDLEKLISSGVELITYDGFEPSGQMHIAQGIQRAVNVNKMIKAGFKFKMLVADWFGYLNNKMGGDINKIQTVGKYFIEIWRASGMDLDGVEFIWTSNMVKDPKYIETVMRVAKANSLKRILKTTQIMGRSENDDLSAAQIFYPCMQTADIFLLGAQVTQLGMDQRKVNMLAREVGMELGYWKPIVVSHHMLQGLGVPKSDNATESVDFSSEKDKFENNRFEIQFNVILSESKDANKSITVLDKSTGRSNEISFDKPETFLNKAISGLTIRSFEILSNGVNFTFEYDKRDPKDRAIDMKMSKSVPDSAIFMTDTSEDVKRKIMKAYCPEGVIEENPILEYCKYILFEAHHLKGQENFLKDGFVVKRPEKFGGDVTYKTYEELEAAFGNKSLFPLDLKNAVVEYINVLLEPVRKHFVENADAKNLLETVQGFQITR